MDFNATEAERLAASAASKLLAPHATITAKLERERSEFSTEDALWKAIVDVGWLSVAIADDTERFGVIATVAEELGRSGIVAPFVDAVSAALMLSSGDDSSPILGEALTKLTTGQILIVPLHQWISGAAINIISAGQDGYCVQAPRILLDWAACADQLVVAAERTPDGTPMVLLLDAAQDGVRLTPAATFDGAGAAWLELEGAICPPGRAFVAQGLRQAQDTAALFTAMEAIGGGRGALQGTTEHVREREQFGRLIGTFQVVQHGLADVQILLDAAALATWEGLTKAARNEDLTGAAALAAWTAQRAFLQAAVSCAQFYGGMGHCEESHLQFHYRRAGTALSRLGSEWAILDTIADAYVLPHAMGPSS